MSARGIKRLTSLFVAVAIESFGTTVEYPNVYFQTLTPHHSHSHYFPVLVAATAAPHPPEVQEEEEVLVISSTYPHDVVVVDDSHVRERACVQEVVDDDVDRYQGHVRTRHQSPLLLLRAVCRPTPTPLSVCHPGRPWPAALRFVWQSACAWRGGN